MSKMSKDLAMAYAIKSKTGKKMANGGPVSAKAERRPSTEETNEDAKMVSHNEGKKPLRDSDMTSRPDKASLKGMRTTPIKHPSMVPSSIVSSRLRSDEDDLQRTAKVNNGPQIQPPERYDEIDAADEGPDHPQLHAKMMAEGGEVDDMDQPMGEEEEEHHASIASAIMARKDKMMAEGGPVELDANEEEHGESYDEANEAAMKENYDESVDDVHTPESDDEHGMSLADEDKEDLVSRIMKRMSSKSPMVK